MKIVKLTNNRVSEIIPDYALPVEEYYGQAFADQCVEAPDDIKQRMVYDPETGTFSEPEPDPIPEPDSEVVTWDALAAAYEEGVNSI